MLGLQCRPRRRQPPLSLLRHRPGSQQLSQRRGVLAKNPLQRQPVLFEQLADLWLHQRGGKTRQRRRYSSQNAIIQHGGLGKVSNLRWSADDGRTREQKILKNWPQQRRRRDALRLGA